MCKPHPMCSLHQKLWTSHRHILCTLCFNISRMRSLVWRLGDNCRQHFEENHVLLLINNHRLSAGSYNSSWSCYFFPETSQECRDRAFELLGNKEALERGIITTKDSYKSKEIWTGRTPRQVIIACVIRIRPCRKLLSLFPNGWHYLLNRVWGEPWSFLQPTTEINGSLVAFHRKMDRRWWRAQVKLELYLERSETHFRAVPWYC